MILFTIMSQNPKEQQMVEQSFSGQVIFDRIFGNNGPTRTIKPVFFQQNGEDTVGFAANDRLYLVNLKTGEAVQYNYKVHVVAHNKELGVVFATTEGIFCISNFGDSPRQIKILQHQVLSNLLLWKKEIFFIDSTGTLQRLSENGNMMGIEFLLPPDITAEEMLFEVGGNILAICGGFVILFDPALDILDQQTMSSYSNKNIVNSGNLWCFLPLKNSLIRIGFTDTELSEPQVFKLNAIDFLGVKGSNILSIINDKDGIILQSTSKPGQPSEPKLHGLRSILIDGNYILLNKQGLFVAKIDDVLNHSKGSPLNCLQITKKSTLKSKFYVKNINDRQYLFLQEGARYILIRLEHAE